MNLRHLLLAMFCSLGTAFTDPSLLRGLVIKPDASEVAEQVTGIDLKEIQAPQKDKLEKILAGYLNQPITKEMLQALQKEILVHYESCGHPLIVISIPEQKTSSGVVQLSLIEAKLGEVRVQGNSNFSSESFSDQIKLVPGEPIDQDQLIQNISYINRHPYRQAQFVYTPGQDPESTDIELMVKERTPFRIYAGAESTGRKQIGRIRYFAGFQWGRFFGMDNQTFSYQYATAENFDYFQAHNINYALFLPNEQILQIFGGYSRIHSLLTDNVARSKGFSLQASLRYNIPLAVKNDYTHEVIVGGDYKRMNNATEFIALTTPRRHNVNLTQIAVGYAGRLDSRLFDMSVEVNGFYSPGRWLADQSDSDYSVIRPNTKSNYAYLTSKWAMAYTMPRDWTVSLMLQGHLAFRNLLPSEQFALGGYNTVRGYSEGTFTCDRAFVGSIEFKTPGLRIVNSTREKWRNELQAVAFIDYGAGDNHETSPGIAKSAWLLGIGPGLRYHLGETFSFRLDWGIQCHEGKVKDSLITFGTIVIF